MAGCNGGEDLVAQEEALHEFDMTVEIVGLRSTELSLATERWLQTNTLEKKYGGLVPKKKPLISKDNERAFFDSADWALGKQGANQGEKSRTVVETLRPKLQRTPHQQLPPRRPTCTSGRETMVD